MRLVRLSSVALAVGLCLLTASGCGSKPGSIEVNPKELRFNSVGEAAPLLVRLLDVEGKAMEHKPFTFISQDGHVADVRQDGTVVSVDSGATDIHVSYAGLTTKVPVRVALPAKVKLSAKCVKRCSVVRASPLSLRLEGIGAEARLISEVLDNEGQKLPLEVEFHAADPDFQAGHRKLGIEVARDGEVTSLGVGKFMVTAGVGSASDQMAIEVFFPVVDKVVAQKTMFLKPDET